MRYSRFRTILLAGCAGVAFSPAFALAQAAPQTRTSYNIPAQDLGTALTQFGQQSEREIVFSADLTRNRHARAVSGEMTATEALAMLLGDSGLSYRTASNGSIIVEAPGPQSGSAAGDGADSGTVQALIVTAQKREEDIQDVPIAISAFTQEDLTTRQVAGGPDLITQIPNMAFTKTNFTSYSIQIRGIGTQAISATTDPAVAVAFNNTPFVRNRFFEQEFYDLERLEVLRGPQGTLYGRNATAGVVNLISAKPKFAYEAKMSADVGNYSSTRIEGMVNFPLVEDVVALRLAGAWTKREGYATNQMTGAQIHGRDLWSGRLSLRFEPTDTVRADLIYEHFEEDDDRLRSGKQLCKKNVITDIGGVPVTSTQGGFFGVNTYLSQGCSPVSLYSPEAFQTPNGYALPFYGPTSALSNPVNPNKDPYLNATQSRDLRVIESSVEPKYRASSDLVEMQVSVDFGENLRLNSETAYNADSLFSMQDYNRFTTAAGSFDQSSTRPGLINNGVFCDPQLGCSDRLLLVDLSTSESTQFSQEFRLASDFDGPANFSLGLNYLRHDAEDKYYVFINSLSLFAGRAFSALDAADGSGPTVPYVAGVSDNSECFDSAILGGAQPVGDAAAIPDPRKEYSIVRCIYIDPNPIGSLNDEGRNYFLSRNPYRLISYAAFGEVYYKPARDWKITGGLRFTVDKKRAPQIPSWLLAASVAGAYPVAQIVDQEWREPTGRLAIDWSPDLSFTDQTLFYFSYAHGYKAGGANPPPPVLVDYTSPEDGSEALPNEFIPDTFGPEFLDAFELGTKNTLFDGALALNLAGFYYDYRGYQISEIRNRSAVNSNYDADVWGLELESDWRVTKALRVGFKGGYNGTRLADGQEAIDLMDRTAGRDDWVVIRPYPTVPSNCILPVAVVTAGGSFHASGGTCVNAYYRGFDPITLRPYDPTITDYTTVTPAGLFRPLGADYANYKGFDPSTAPNGGRGFAKNLSGNELPNAPRYTATLTLDYTKPLVNDWMMTLHGDYHYQSKSWGRVINSDPYDRIEGFSTVNASAIFTNEDAGWKVMAYVKNVFDETAITGTFLNSDDTGLTTNVFLTEPRLYGVRVTKDFTGGGWLGDIGRCPDGGCPMTVELGGAAGDSSAETSDYAPEWLRLYSAAFPLSQAFQDEDLDVTDMRSIKLTYAPSPDWRVSGTYRFGKTKGFQKTVGYEEVEGGYSVSRVLKYVRTYIDSPDNHLRAAARDSEEHAIVDFMVGREADFGLLGREGASTLSAGLRHADLRSTSIVTMDGVPARVSPPEFSTPTGYICCLPFRTFEAYTTSLTSDRGFQGAGPSVTWDASARLFGNEERGHVDVNWSVGGAVLFGKQTAHSEEKRWGRYFIFPESVTPAETLYDDSIARSRSRDITVPNLSLALGLSYSVDRIKVSTGYSYDRFFNAIDGGYTEHKAYDRTIRGPYFKIAVGFGG